MKIKIRLRLVLTLVILCLNITPAYAAESGKILNAKEIYSKCSSSVFFIETYDMYGDLLAEGSGFFIDEKGYAVTNLHVLEGAFSAKAVLADKREVAIKNITGINQASDVAIIKLDDGKYPYLIMGDSSKAEGGEKIYTLGSPLGLSNTISEGIISNPGRNVDDKDYIQISAPISSGSSGGALINNYGKAIGITSAGYDDGQNLNFAVPINVVKSIMEHKPESPYTFENLALILAKAEAENRPEVMDLLIDEYEPNNTLDYATYISNGTTITGVIDKNTSDYFFTACNAPGIISIYCFSTDNTLKDVSLAVTDTAQSEVIYGESYVMDDGNMAIGCEVEVVAPDYIYIGLKQKDGTKTIKGTGDYMFYCEFIPYDDVQQ